MRAPITLGLHLPNFNLWNTDADGLFEQLAATARAAEDAGFSSLTVMDHLHQIPPHGPQTNWMFEGNMMLAALATQTSRVSLGLLVGGVTYRNPALLAKMTTTLDVISGGRAIHGIGAAWFEDEHRAFGFDFPPLRERFERLEDALRIARAMFTQQESSVEGTHHATTGVINSPQPVRGDIPILIGGSGERKTLRLVAKYADGCNVFGDPDTVRHLMGVLERHCEDVGRDPAEITKTRAGTTVIAPSHDDAMAIVDRLRQGGMPEERIQAQVIAGDPGEVAEQAQAFLDAGVDGLTMSMPNANDVEAVRLAGETLAPLVGSPVS